VGADRGALIASASALLEKLRGWSALCEANFAHKRLLVEAELARVEERPEAASLYEAAATSAAGHRYVQHAALAHELAACWHAARGSAGEAQRCAAAARDAYARWGAAAKVAHVKERFG
jgi:hypothetical protein